MYRRGIGNRSLTSDRLKWARIVGLRRRIGYRTNFPSYRRRKTASFPSETICTYKRSVDDNVNVDGGEPPLGAVRHQSMFDIRPPENTIRQNPW
jgi:hypothetical protein